MKSLLLIPGLPLVYLASAAYWFVASRVIERKMGVGAGWHPREERPSGWR